jgi:hypothetical protein
MAQIQCFMQLAWARHGANSPARDGPDDFEDSKHAE